MMFNQSARPMGLEPRPDANRASEGISPQTTPTAITRKLPCSSWMERRRRFPIENLIRHATKHGGEPAERIITVDEIVKLEIVDAIRSSGLSSKGR